MNQMQNLSSAQQNMKGRALMLKMYSSLKFYDQQLKKVVNENLHLMEFLGQKAINFQQQEALEQEDATNDETEEQGAL
jgi:hypothetical protein